MTAKRKPRKKVTKKAAELISGTPPVPSIVEPKPKPTVWQRIKSALGW